MMTWRDVLILLACATVAALMVGQAALRQESVLQLIGTIISALLSIAMFFVLLLPLSGTGTLLPVWSAMAAAVVGIVIGLLWGAALAPSDRSR